MTDDTYTFERTGVNGKGYATKRVYIMKKQPTLAELERQAIEKAKKHKITIAEAQRLVAIAHGFLRWDSLVAARKNERI